MRMIQLLPTLAYGDAVGNDAVALHHIIAQQGYDTKIYAENVDDRIDRGIAEHYSAMPKLSEEDILLYHFSVGAPELAKLLQKLPCRKLMIYHNVTPGEFFAPYDANLADFLDASRGELRAMRGLFECCMAVSEYNRQELLSSGYTCPVYVLPVLIPFGDYDRPPAREVLDRYKDDGYTNILFVGRISPNKKCEDAVAAFAWYKRHINGKSRLFLVGNDHSMELYADRLRRYIAEMELTKDVIFSGHIPFSHILAYYKVSDVFLCMSEHEGFCVPLVEAMKFGLPIVAYGTAAIPETLESAGLLLDSKEPALVAKAMDAVLRDKELGDALRERGRKRLESFSYERIRENFLGILSATVSRAKDAPEIRTIPSLPEHPLATKAKERISAEAANADRRGVLPFDSIPVLSEQNAPMTPKRLVKKMILKPVYRKMRIFAPDLADQIRNRIYRAMGRGGPAENTGRAPGLLVDVTFISKNNLGTGIQRVVNNVYRHLSEKGGSVLPVRDEFGRLLTSNAYAYRQQGREQDAPPADELVSFLPGDRLFLLDSSWDYYRDFKGILQQANDAGLPSFVMVYDLLPILYPELTTAQEFVNNFRGWHDMVFQQATDVICISRYTADTVHEYCREQGFQRKTPLRIHSFHLGADIVEKTGEARQDLQDFVKEGITFLMVGTVEPRKGHHIAVEAFRKVLSHADARLLILGHDGWKNDEIKDRIASPALKNCVKWVDDASDAELQWAYRHASALIAASKDEGFGLPLVEAAYFGLPIICSDIPVFREVTQGYADYFKSMDPDALAEAVERWLGEEQHPDTNRVHIYTWKEAAEEITAILEGRVAPYREY